MNSESAGPALEWQSAHGSPGRCHSLSGGYWPSFSSPRLFTPARWTGSRLQELPKPARNTIPADAMSAEPMRERRSRGVSCGISELHVEADRAIDGGARRHVER